MTLRKVILKTHMVLGLAAGIFLAILGLTGSIMAFEGDLDHWLHPERWYVTPRGRPLPEHDLLSVVRNRFPRAPVIAVLFPRAANLAQMLQLTDGTSVYLNPYDGTVLGETVGPSNSDRFIGYVHQFHLRLVPYPRSAPKLAEIGKVAVSVAGLLLCLLVPTGWTLWWRSKRTTIRFRMSNWKEHWSLIFHDAHHAVGIYASLFLLIASITGVLIGFDFGEKFFYSATHSSAPPRQQAWQSVPVPGANPMTSDQVLDIARRTMPGATVAMMVVPLRTTGAYTMLMRVPEETSEAVHSTIAIDQYSGKVLNVRNYMTESAGYRLIRFNRSIHTGDIFGLPSHILVSLSSLALVAMAISGLVIWWKKLA
jgi:uncharacterized iron-regulated membrane protein